MKTIELMAQELGMSVEELTKVEKYRYISKKPDEVAIQYFKSVCPCCGKYTKYDYKYILVSDGCYPIIMDNKCLVKVHPLMITLSTAERLARLRQQTFKFRKIIK